MPLTIERIETPQCTIRTGARIRVPNIGEGSLVSPVMVHRIEPPKRAFQKRVAWWEAEAAFLFYDGSDSKEFPPGTCFAAYVSDSREVKTIISQPAEEPWWTRL